MLHDIGHGPFSHALEALWGPRHEVWGERVLLDPETDVHQVLARFDASFPAAVADVIMKRHPNRLAVSMVSGQLDADRLDYLMRDSLFTGVDYGKFDLERILRVILPMGDRLVVKRTGIHTVEAYLLARYFMYWQVYFHPVCRSAEIVLKKTLERARDLAAEGKAPSVSGSALGAWLKGEPLSFPAYLALDDHVLLAVLAGWQREAEDPVLRDLAGRLLDRRLFRYREYPVDTNPRRFGEMEQAVAAVGLPPQYYVEVDETSGVYYDYYVGEEGRAGDDGPLYLWDGSDLIEMSRLSRPLQGIARERQRERYLYYPAEAAPMIEGLWARRGRRHGRTDVPGGGS
jgi:hypothetical protein